MTQVKQKTVNGKTLKLVRKKSPLQGERYVYEIKDEIGNIIEEDAGTTKKQAMDEFERTADLYREDNSQKQGKTDNSFLGDPLL